MEIHGVSLRTEHLSSLMWCLVLLQLSMWLRWRDTRDTINSGTHTHSQPRYKWYTHPDMPAIWLPGSLFSCFTLTNTTRINRRVDGWYGVASDRKKDLVSKLVLVCTNMKERRKQRKAEGKAGWKDLYSQIRLRSLSWPVFHSVQIGIMKPTLRWSNCCCCWSALVLIKCVMLLCWRTHVMAIVFTFSASHGSL